jgi:hypothetical protein
VPLRDPDQHPSRLVFGSQTPTDHRRVQLSKLANFVVLCSYERRDSRTSDLHWPADHSGSGRRVACVLRAVLKFEIEVEASGPPPPPNFIEAEDRARPEIFRAERKP